MTFIDEMQNTATLKSDKRSTVDSESKMGDISPDEEKRLVSKLDKLILPFATLLYLSAYLDRGNVGNAKLQGLKKELLDNQDIKFSVVLCAFYITYIVFSIPGTLLSRAIIPSTCIAMGAMIWSIAASAMAASHSYGAIVTCRLFIGVGEALFAQSVCLYFSIWYKKNEVSRRLAVYVGAGAFAGAFGGLIAYGVAHIKSKVAAWRILFLIEGLPSIILAIAIFFFLPSRPEKTRYLSARERDVLASRLKEDGLYETYEHINWRGVRRSLTDWKSYVIALLFSCMNLTLGSVSGFLPTIIRSLGWNDASAQLHTVPPYAVSLVFMLGVSVISDKSQSRGIPIACVFAISSVGWIILLTVEGNQDIRYLATFFVVIGGYAAAPLIVSWVANNTAIQSQRATSLGLLNTVGQCLSIVSAFIFPEAEKPGWKKGFSTNLAFNLLAILLALGMSAYFRIENRRRDKVEAIRHKQLDELSLVDKCDLTPGFRYVP